MKKIKLSILFTGIVGASIYIFSNINILYEKTDLSSFLSLKQKSFLKNYIFPQIKIKQEVDKNAKSVKKLNEIKFYLAQLELLKKNSGTDIETAKSNFDLKEVTNSKLHNSNLEKYMLTTGFYSGIHRNFPGSGYIDFHENDMIIVSSRGLLAFSKNFPSKKYIFKQIKNNIDEFINLKQFKKSNHFSIKDLLIFKRNIYISYTEEISEDCWNTSVIYGKFNFSTVLNL